MDSKTYPVLVEDVRKWWINLNILVVEIKSRGKRPVLVALSRKMLRLMNWITSDSDFRDSLPINDLIRGEEIITELALPFLTSQINGENVEFIILDDIIIHGTTLRTVYQNLCKLFDTTVHVSCIFRYDRAKINDFVNPSDLSKIKSIPQETIEEYTDVIAETVKHNQLPIDMEFPIFKIDHSIREIEHAIDQHSAAQKYYSGDECLAYDFGTGPMVGNNVDFCKARFFGKNDFTLLEVFSPIVISESDILSVDNNLFGNTLYAELWEKLTKDLRIVLSPEYNESSVQIVTQLRESCVRSLVVIANYLFALSALAMNIDTILPNGLKRGIILSKDDLSLLIGRNLADNVYGSVMATVKVEEVFISPREIYLDIPSSFAPKPFETEIDRERFLAALVAKSPSDAFDSIFRYQHYTNPKFENPYIAYERLFFGETHKSLSEVTCIFFNNEECDKELYSWIDENIDAGYIVPKYEVIKSKNGGLFWRRFFHAGIRRKGDISV